MIKLKSIVIEALYKNTKEFQIMSKHGKIWRAIVSPSVQNSPDNPNHWPFRVTLFSFLKGKYTPIDHQYLTSCKDEIVFAELKSYELGDWERLR
jgi:hypothetical protein